MRQTNDSNGGALPPPRPYPETYPPARVPGWPVAYYPCLDSTNLEAKRRIAAGEAQKRLILAESQTNGQCRHDRLWESSPAKGIWASFIRPVTVPLETLPQSTLVLAVAVRAGIEDATGITLQAKWPNDLLGNGQKCCGLLVETAMGADAAQSAPLILGAGINCNHAVDDFPPYLRGIAVSLSILAGGALFDRAALLASVARGINHWFDLWEKEGFAPVRDAWLAHNCTLGKTVLLPDGYGHALAVAEDLDPTGALVAAAPSGDRLRIDSGEIGFADPAQHQDKNR